jgi:hypothetical protein
MPRRGGLGPAREQLEAGHVNILRQILGLRKSTPRHIVLMEGISAPLRHSWILRTATFWNTLGSFHADSIFRRVALDSVSQALDGMSNWASAFASSLESVAYPFALELGVLQPVDMTFLRRLLVQQLTVLTVPDHTCPRTCPSEGVISCTYAQWFQRPLVRCPRLPMIHLTLPVKIHRQFMRFRSGCSDLPIDKGRHQSPKIPRAQRVCVHCQSAAVCDEFHLIFECPYMQPLRDEYYALFTPNTNTMVQFMWQKDSAAVAIFVVRCLRRMLSPES